MYVLITMENSCCHSVKILTFFFVNGRIGSDLGGGGFTRSDTTGRSVVNYLLTTPTTFAMIKYFHIYPKYPELDHLPTGFSITCDTTSDDDPGKQEFATWHPHVRYIWDKSSLANMVPNLKDSMSDSYYESYKSSMVNLDKTDTVESKLNSYISQACQRLFQVKSTKVNRHKQGRPRWYEAECRAKRAEAFKAGEHVTTKTEENILLQSCCEYRAIKQKKQRMYQQTCIHKIEETWKNRGSRVTTNFFAILKVWRNIDMIIILITLTWYISSVCISSEMYLHFMYINVCTHVGICVGMHAFASAHRYKNMLNWVSTITHVFKCMLQHVIFYHL